MIPPMRNQTNDVMKYSLPMTLWSVVVSHLTTVCPGTRRVPARAPRLWCGQWRSARDLSDSRHELACRLGAAARGQPKHRRRCLAVRRAPNPISGSGDSPEAAPVGMSRLVVSGMGLPCRDCRHGDFDAALDNPDRVDRDRAGGRRPGRDPGRQLETRAVPPAFHLPLLDVTVGEGDLSVAADVEEGMDQAVAAGQADRVPGQVGVDRSVVPQLVEATCCHPHEVGVAAHGH